MNISPLSIGPRSIGSDQPGFLIAEVAQAHDGSLGTAHAFIDLAQSVGADAIKFQTHIAEAETTPLEEFRVKFSYEDPTRFDYWKRMEFTKEQWAGLAKHAEEKKLIFLSSAFSFEAIDLLEKLNMPAWKVASGEVSNLPLLERMHATGKPILLSSGLSSIAETTKAVTQLQDWKTPYGVFQCTSKYPTPYEDVGLNILDDFTDRFKCPVGLSDHSGTPYPALAALARGAHMIEAHLAFNEFQFGPDTVASLNPEQFKQLSKARDAFHTMLTHPVNKDHMAENFTTMRHLFNKSLALRSPQTKGTVLSEKMLSTKKPGTGIPAADLKNYIGRTLIRDISHLELLAEEDFI